MKEYRPVVKFKYKNEYFQMFIDENDKMFFLRIINENQYSFVTMEQLITFYEKFRNSKTPLIQSIKKDRTKKCRFLPKVLYKGVIIVLTAVTLLTGCANKKNKGNYNIQFDSGTTITTTYETDYQNAIDPDIYEIVDQVSVAEDDLVVEKYLADEYSRYISILDSDYLDKVLSYSSVSNETIHETIDMNPNIGDKMKPVLHEFVTRISQKYPNMDLRVLYENLKTLEIVECNKEDLIIASMSWDSYGCYKVSENKIYVLEDNKYIEGTWDFQVIYHELSHMMRSANWDYEGKQVRVRSSFDVANEIITDEALNSVFAVSLFNYEEKDIAYQLQSNYFKTMIECMDNYTIDDYMQHSTSYFAQKLDEQNGDTNYATVLFKLIESQYTDYHDEDITIEQSEFYPIYDYIMDMYFAKHITSETTRSEARTITDELVEKIMFDVPQEYNIDVQHFYDYVETYCDNLGIESERVM